MKNKRSAPFIVICEDAQHAAFARRFLRFSGIRNHHDLRIEYCEPGKQDAKQWIRDELPGELQGFRRYNAKNRSAERVLFVMADADDKTVEQRITYITSKCNPKPNTSENVCFIIPRWAVETWIKYFRGESADESKKILSKHKLRAPGDCWPEVKQLKKICDSGSLSKDAPDSLHKACSEFQRIRPALKR